MFKNFLKYFLYFVIFAALGAGGSYLFFKIIDLSKNVEVPVLTGRSITEAIDIRTRNISTSIVVEKPHVSEQKLIELTCRFIISSRSSRSASRAVPGLH